MLADILGWVLVLIGLTVSVPQVFRIIRTRHIEGLSLAVYLLGAISWSGWMVYTASDGQWPRFAAQAFALTLDMVILGMMISVLTRQQGWTATWHDMRPTMPWVALSAVAIATGGVLAGFPGVLAVLTAIDLCTLLPLIRTTVLSPTLRGVSAWTWGLRTGVCIGWVAYAYLIGNPWSAATTHISVIVGVFMLTRLAMDRARHRPAADAPNPHNA